MPRRAPAAALAVLAVATALAGCGGGGDRGCGPIEQVQPQFPATHFLPGQPEPRYLSDPPTSGPHVGGVSVPSGVTEPLARPVQVGLLELGVVLLQFRPADTSPQEEARLRELEGPRVVVAPNPELPDPVVASAWLALQRCDRVDAAALSRFAHDHASDTSGGHVDG